MIGLADPSHQRVPDGGRAIHLGLALIEGLFGYVAPLEEKTRALELLFRQCHLASLLVEVGTRQFKELLRLKDLGLRLAERGFEVAGVHPGDNLPRFHHIAFFGQDLGDAAGEFRGDVDLVRLEPAVSPGDPGRQPCLGLPPPIDAANYGNRQRQQRKRGLDRPPLASFRHRLRCRNPNRQVRALGRFDLRARVLSTGRAGLLELDFLHHAL